MLINHAQPIAQAFVHAMKPVCDRIEIAGSIRRGKTEVGDIEIVCIPTPQMDLFGKKGGRDVVPELFTLQLRQMQSHGWITSIEKDGPRWKRLQWRPPGCAATIPLDLFITTPACWGVIFAIRTGPSTFSKQLVTPRSKNGFLPDDCKVDDGRVWRFRAADQWDPLDTPEEIDFLQLTIGRWIEPPDRFVPHVPVSV
jgi:DNA polymerase/3'-5' exonuclease PolX